MADPGDAVVLAGGDSVALPRLLDNLVACDPDLRRVRAAIPEVDAPVELELEDRQVRVAGGAAQPIRGLKVRWMAAGVRIQLRARDRSVGRRS